MQGHVIPEIEPFEKRWPAVRAEVKDLVSDRDNKCVLGSFVSQPR